MGLETPAAEIHAVLDKVLGHRKTPGPQKFALSKERLFIMSLSATSLKALTKDLEARRAKILRAAEETRADGMVLDTDDLPDEMDLASSEAMQSFEFRIRGREKSLLGKIEQALTRIQDGTYGLCEECGEPIAERRLIMRPEASLCVQCKEEQEKQERNRF
jgi:DnaK suppressor protein